MILLVANEKGGTGKTILAVNLVVMLALAGRKALLIDADRQGSAVNWAAIREQAGVEPGITVLSKTGPALRFEVLELAEQYDDVIIDAGGRDSQELRAAILAADMILVPFRPSQFDVWGLDRMAVLIGEARTINTHLKGLAVINLASPHPGVGEIEDARDFLKDVKEIQPARTVLRERIIYRRASSEGLAVVELKPADKKAVEELKSLFSEVLDA